MKSAVLDQTKCFLRYGVEVKQWPLCIYFTYAHTVFAAIRKHSILAFSNSTKKFKVAVLLRTQDAGTNTEKSKSLAGSTVNIIRSTNSCLLQWA